MATENQTTAKSWIRPRWFYRLIDEHPTLAYAGYVIVMGLVAWWSGP